MHNFHNIESRKFSGDDYYVGYGRLCSVWRIHRHGKGRNACWYCSPAHMNKAGQVPFYKRTLAEVSKELDCR